MPICFFPGDVACLRSALARLRAQLQAAEGVIAASGDYIDELQYDLAQHASEVGDTVAARDKWDNALAAYERGKGE